MSRILVVDDDPAVQKFISRLLESLGHTYFMARSSVEGIELLEKEKLDLIFLDIMLSGATSGRRFLVHYHHLLQNHKIIDIPIFLISAISEKELEGIMHAYPSVKRYYQKPFNLERLVMDLKEYLPDTVA